MGDWKCTATGLNRNTCNRYRFMTISVRHLPRWSEIQCYRCQFESKTHEYIELNKLISEIESKADDNFVTWNCLLMQFTTRDYHYIYRIKSIQKLYKFLAFKHRTWGRNGLYIDNALKIRRNNRLVFNKIPFPTVEVQYVWGK